MLTDKDTSNDRRVSEISTECWENMGGVGVGSPILAFGGCQERLTRKRDAQFHFENDRVQWKQHMQSIEMNKEIS